MPPKGKPSQRRVSMAPGTKTQDGVAAATLSKGNYRNVANASNANPIKRTSMARTADIRRARDSYAKQIADEKAEQERDMRDLRQKIAFFRKDNEKLLKNQRVKWGMTLDEMQVAREQLHDSKGSNDELYRELESKKSDCDKLQAELQSLTNKISIAMLELNDLNRERKLNAVDKVKLVEAEKRAGRLFKANRDLRSTLLRNKVDPNVDALTMSSLNSYVMPPPRQRVPKTLHLPQIITKENLLSFRSMDDIRHDKKPRRTSIKRTRSFPQQQVSPKLFLTQHQGRQYGNAEVYV